MPIRRHNKSEIRRAIRMLGMVHELHKQGYQKIRIAPGLERSDSFWECSVTYAKNIQATHGALLYPDIESKHVAYYTTAFSNQYFGWDDAATDGPRQLADKFAQRFPIILAHGRGKDWEYAGWFVSMLGIAESGCLPVAYSGGELELIDGKLSTTSISDTRVFISMPPTVGL